MKKFVFIVVIMLGRHLCMCDIHGASLYHGEVKCAELNTGPEKRS
jgi:hypothetical protein